MLTTIIRALAADYSRLPDLLTPGTGSGDQSGIRVQQVNPPLPLNVDVSDLLRDVASTSAAWEWELCREFWLPVTPRSRHAEREVPAALRWVASTIDSPPESHVGGYWMPGVLSDVTHSWITETATLLHRRVSALTRPTPRPVRALNPCPECGRATLMTQLAEGAVRCVNAGCGYERSAA